MSHCDQGKHSSEHSDVGSYNCPSNRDHRDSSHKNLSHSEIYVNPSVMMVMRHSERVDDCFPGWIEKCNKDGKYEPFDLNMPSRLPIQRPLKDYVRDTCLTRSGVVLAQMMGRGLLMTDNTPDVIYSSPSLRCIQTATWVRDMSGCQSLIRVENGLFENFRYPNGVPRFITPLQRHIFPVDKTFRPFLSLETVVGKQETNDEYNERIKMILNAIAEQSEVSKTEKELKVLVVAHASTVDMAVGLMRDKPRKTVEMELDNIAIPVPYCSLAYLKKKGSHWVPVAHQVPPVTYEFLSTKYNHYFVHRP
ncbi:hypothetical protein CAEBREN_14631 [Caenorhabditis brenneri]|uniref:Uncharacterized protein n=1 Tax=Caenorhabditis brenneri TaxID=135651 RepID=G0MQ19_CAEBE|nr:hypothetical protein CAEBREN_14631 [Caenorhabditis brenneri]